MGRPREADTNHDKVVDGAHSQAQRLLGMAQVLEQSLGHMMEELEGTGVKKYPKVAAEDARVAAHGLCNDLTKLRTALGLEAYYDRINGRRMD